MCGSTNSRLKLTKKETAVSGYIGMVEKKMEITIIGLCRDSG